MSVINAGVLVLVLDARLVPTSSYTNSKRSNLKKQRFSKIRESVDEQRELRQREASLVCVFLPFVRKTLLSQQT